MEANPAVVMLDHTAFLMQIMFFPTPIEADAVEMICI